MKRKKSILALSLILICSLQGHAQFTAGFEAAILGVLEKTHIDEAADYVLRTQQFIENINTSYQQLQNTIEMNKRAFNNLKGIADIKSFDEFMKWNNRQLYLEQQSEAAFNNLGVKIGEKTYHFSEIDKVPDAFVDEFAGDFTEEDRAEMYYKLGLSPSNYAYIQTWQAREDAIAESILTRSQIIAAEQDAAAERNSDINKRYTEENSNLDSNQILKETGITLSNVEMVLRELTGLIAQKNEYDLARDKEDDAPANTPASTEQYFKNHQKPITKGFGMDNYRN